MEPRSVVAAAILNNATQPTHLLCAQRSYPADLRGYYELPGGKIENAEAPEEALHREITEELDLDIAILKALPYTDDEPRWAILNGRRMYVWTATIENLRATHTTANYADTVTNDVTHEHDTHKTSSLPFTPIPPLTPGKDHLSLDWVPITQAHTINWLPTNLPIVERLQEVLLNQ